MIWHPLLLAVLLLDTLSFLMVAAAAPTALRIASGWSPESASRDQISLEVKAETASIQVRSAAVVFCTATVILITAISNVLPTVVPGAMCGTGVLQACKGLGNRALGFRLLAIAGFYLAAAIDRLNRTQPNSPLTTMSARAALLLLPMVFLAYLDSGRAIFALDVHKPVDCCTVVYDQVRAFTKANTMDGIPGAFLVWGFVSGGVVLTAGGARLWLAKVLPRAPYAYALLVLALIWVPLAYTALVRVLVAYHYQVLFHHCPWCLFLSEHRLVGYPLFAALTLTWLEGCASFVTIKIAAVFPQLADPARRRLQAAGLRIAIGSVLFMGLAGLPALIWRIRFGVWM